ncbi:MAG: enoyl-CoA hydratase/isomerase family protein [Sciscionella sp.]
MTQQLAAPVEVRVGGAVATVTVGTGQRCNALGNEAWRRLDREFTALSVRSSLRVVVVRGAGASFCAGSDMTEWSTAGPADVEESFALMESSFRAIEACPVPVIAEIRGSAAGAGCQLALACDLRVMAESGRIGMPIARLGILSSPAFAARMAQLVGPEMTRELLYTGRLLDAGQAVTARMVGAAVPEAELTTYVEGLVENIACQPPTTIRAAKHAVTAAIEKIPRHSPGPTVCFPDFQRGVASFLGRR